MNKGQKPNEGSLAKEFSNIKWTVGKADIKTLETGTLIEENEQLLVYKTKILGKESVVSYSFGTSRLLEMVNYHITEKHTVKEELLKEYQTMKELLNKEYGESFDGNSNTLSEEEHIAMMSIWELDHTIINNTLSIMKNKEKSYWSIMCIPNSFAGKTNG